MHTFLIAVSHSALIGVSIYIGFVLVAGSVVFVSTHRNRLSLVVIIVILPGILAFAVISTIIDFMSNGYSARTKQAVADMRNPEILAAIAEVEKKRAELFGGAVRTRNLANELRERYCIHLTRSTSSVNSFIDHHRRVAA
jgi:hypothetical protein